ncbi:hypothetical protein J6590_003739 [Homalodisca vitripennis]|nr:hypothetical protein J6590_003739 [Homalodisca vitripennis]
MVPNILLFPNETECTSVGKKIQSRKGFGSLTQIVPKLTLNAIRNGNVELVSPLWSSRRSSSPLDLLRRFGVGHVL